MKNIERGSIKHLIVSTVAIIVIGVILYPLFDMAYFKFITHSEFIYSFIDHALKPISIGLVIGICLWLVDKHANKKK